MSPTAQETAEALWGLTLAIVGSAVVLTVVGVLVARSARAPLPASVVTSLTILATLALVGYAVGGESRPELAAIAGTAVGALAGATTSLLTRHPPAREVRPHLPDVPPGPEELDEES